MRVVIVDAGEIGTAMAVVLAYAGHDATLLIQPFDFPHFEMFNYLSKTGKNQKGKRENDLHLPGIELPENIKFTDSFDITPDCDAVFLAVPSKFLYSAYQKLIPSLEANKKRTTLVLLSKGLNDYEKMPWGLTLRNYLRLVGGFSNFAVLYGYTPAHYLAEAHLTKRFYAASAASYDLNVLKKVRSIFRGTHLGILGTTDITGVAWGSILAKVYSIGYGILEERLALAEKVMQEFGGDRNIEKMQFLARQYLEVCVLREMKIILNYAGAKEKTLYSPAVRDDFIGTCVGEIGWESRNVKFGKFLAEYHREEEIEAYIKDPKNTVEGYESMRTLWQIAQDNKLDSPLLHAIHAICLFGASPDMLGLVMKN